jgi:two-component system chemotaxis sensor kinase CheA
MDQFKAKFLEEAEDLLAALEKALLSLEQDQASGMAVEEVFRVMHTLKGNSTMFGFEHVGEFTHHLETIFDQIRQGKKSVNTAVLDISLASVDHIRLLLENENLEGSGKQARHQEMLSSVMAVSEEASSSAPSGESGLAKESGEGQVNSFYIQFIPHADLLKNGSNPLYLIDDLHALGKCRAFPRTAALPGLAEAEATSCYTAWDILLATSADESEIQDVFLFVADEATIKAIVIAETDIFELKDIDQLIEQLRAEEELVPLEKMREFLPVVEMEAPSPGQEQLVKEQRISSIRVPSDKLDKLMNLVSELVTTQARLSLFAEQQGKAELIAIAEEVEKISRRLRDDTFSISLIPIEHLFVRFQRLVRDLSQQLRKEVTFLTEGGETELDKAIIESLTDPLLHILRNCIDHGIESAEERLAANKPAKGKIVLKAFNSGTYVNIQISDDGVGIKPERIKAKAVSKGLIPADAQLSQNEIYDLLFLPGFSTASRLTEVSGRGVGMDVVKRKISDIRGDIQIASEPGKGTSLTIRLPLTLSVIDGLLVKIADTHFVIPLSVVDRCYEVKREQLANCLNESVMLDDALIPFLDLKKKLGYLTESKESSLAATQYEYIILIEQHGLKVGIVADAIVGEHQAVLKPLGKVYKHQDFVSGATILGDGTIALVMDTNKMVDKFSIQTKNMEI